MGWRTVSAIAVVVVLIACGTPVATDVAATPTRAIDVAGYTTPTAPPATPTPVASAVSPTATPSPRQIATPTATPRPPTATVASSPTSATAQAPEDPTPNGFIDQNRGTYLIVQLTPGEFDYGWFDFAVPGVGLFTATGAQVTVTSPTAVRVVYDGLGTLDANATLDSEFTLWTVPSGQSTEVTLRLEAELNPEARTGTAQLWSGGRRYDMVAEAPPHNAEPVLAEIVAALIQQDWARLYNHADRHLRESMSEAEFVAWFNSDLQAVGTLTGVRVLVAPTYIAQKAGYHAASALLELTLAKDGATTVRQAEVILVVDGGAWRFHTFVPDPAGSPSDGGGKP